MMKPLDNDLAVRSLNYHGQQLTNFMMDNPLFKTLNISDVDYGLYRSRSQQLRVEDRGQRLLLHRFIARNLESLFVQRVPLIEPYKKPSKTLSTLDKFIPPFDTFLSIATKTDRILHFFDSVEIGDVLLLRTQAAKCSTGILLLVEAFDPFWSDKRRYLTDLKIKVLVPSNSVPDTINLKHIEIGGLMRARVVDITKDAHRLLASLIQDIDCPDLPPLGPIKGGHSSESLTLANAAKTKNIPMKMFLSKSNLGANPSDYKSLANSLNVPTKCSSLMPSMIKEYSKDTMLSGLKKKQAYFWAHPHVLTGISHFKNGNSMEAFQCFSHALRLDPENVEGLVARGALHANNGAFNPAINDFRLALKENPHHKNAKNYLIETLLALAGSYEDEKEITKAIQTYEILLNDYPDHQGAKNSIKYLKGEVSHRSSKHQEEMHHSAMTIDSDSCGLDFFNRTTNKEGSVSPLSQRMMKSTVSSNKSNEKPSLDSGIIVPKINQFSENLDDIAADEKKKPAISIISAASTSIPSLPSGCNESPSVIPGFMNQHFSYPPQGFSIYPGIPQAMPQMMISQHPMQESDYDKRVRKFLEQTTSRPSKKSRSPRRKSRSRSRGRSIRRKRSRSKNRTKDSRSPRKSSKTQARKQRDSSISSLSDEDPLSQKLTDFLKSTDNKEGNKQLVLKNNSSRSNKETSPTLKSKRRNASPSLRKAFDIESESDDGTLPLKLASKKQEDEPVLLKPKKPSSSSSLNLIEGLPSPVPNPSFTGKVIYDHVSGLYKKQYSTADRNNSRSKSRSRSKSYSRMSRSKSPSKKSYNQIKRSQSKSRSGRSRSKSHSRRSRSRSRSRRSRSRSHRNKYRSQRSRSKSRSRRSRSRSKSRSRRDRYSSSQYRSKDETYYRSHSSSSQTTRSYEKESYQSSKYRASSSQYSKHESYYIDRSKEKSPMDMRDKIHYENAISDVVHETLEIQKQRKEIEMEKRRIMEDLEKSKSSSAVSKISSCDSASPTKGENSVKELLPGLSNIDDIHEAVAKERKTKLEMWRKSFDDKK